MLRKRIITLLQFIFFLGLGVFIVWWMSKGIDDKGWLQIAESIRKAKFILFLPVFLLLLLSHFFRALRWKILMEPLGYKPTTFNVFNAVMIGYMANLALPRLGEVLKCTILARYEKLGPDKLVGTIVAERAVDLMCLISVFMITILVQFSIVGDFALQLIRKAGSSIQGNLNLKNAAILILISVVLYLLFRLFRKRTGNHTLTLKIKSILNGIWSGLISIRYIQKKGLFILYSLIIWSLYFLSSWIGFYAMEEVAHLGPKEALSILSFGSIGMIVTQGGLGAYQFAIQETLLLYQIPQLVGFTFGWILWIAQTAVLLLGGLFSFIVLPIINRDER
jgi:uncharacterized protein (TIRG00374 family)